MVLELMCTGVQHIHTLTGACWIKESAGVIMQGEQKREGQTVLRVVIVVDPSCES